MKKKLIIMLIFIIGFTSASEFGYNNPKNPQLVNIIETISSISSSGSSYNSSYNNLLGQNCPVGYVVNGTLINGSLICTQVSSSSTGGLNGTAQAGNHTYWNNATFLNSSKLKENSTFIGITNSSGYILIGFYHLPTADIRRQALLVGAGLEGEPSIRPSGDPNTGFWFPFDDDLRVSVGGTAWQRFTGGSQPTVAFDSRVRFSWNDGAIGTSTIAGFSLGKNTTSGGFKQAINLTGNSATQRTNSTLNTLAVHFPVGDYGNTLPTCGTNTNRTLSANDSGLYYCQTTGVWGRVTLT